MRGNIILREQDETHDPDTKLAGVAESLRATTISCTTCGMAALRAYSTSGFLVSQSVRCGVIAKLQCYCGSHELVSVTLDKISCGILQKSSKFLEQQYLIAKFMPKCSCSNRTKHL